MTNEEAIARLEDEKRCVVGACDEHCKYWETHKCHKDEWQSTQFEAINMAIESIEKQIPVKPTIYENKYSDDKAAHCPKCEANGHYGLIDYTRVVNGKKYWKFGKPKFCSCCGQKLDWGENE